MYVQHSKTLIAFFLFYCAGIRLVQLGLLESLSSLFLMASLKRNFQDAIPLVNILSILVLHINIDMGVKSLLRNFFNHIVKLGAILLLSQQPDQTTNMDSEISSYLREAFNFLSALALKFIYAKEIACLKTIAFDQKLKKIVLMLLDVDASWKIKADTLLAVVVFQDLIVNVANGLSISSLDGTVTMKTHQWRSVLRPAMNKLSFDDLLALVKKAEDNKAIIVNLHLMASYMRHDLVDQTKSTDACRKVLTTLQDIVLNSNEDVRLAAIVGMFELFAMVAASSSTRLFHLLILQPWHLFLTETILLELILNGRVPGSHLLYLFMMLEFSFRIRNKLLLELFGPAQVKRLLSLWADETLPKNQKLALALLLKQLHECKSPHIADEESSGVRSALLTLGVSSEAKPSSPNTSERQPLFIRNVDGIFILPTTLTSRWTCRTNFVVKSNSTNTNELLSSHFQTVSSALSMYTAAISD